MTAALGQRLVVLFALLTPLIGVAAPKGSVVILLVAGLAGLWHWVRAGLPAPPFAPSLAITLAGLAVWAAVASAWSVAPAGALFLVLRLVVVCVAGVGLVYAVRRLDDDHRSKAENAFLIGLALALATLGAGFAYAKVTGDSLWSSFNVDPLTTLNTGAVAVGLLGWPALALLWRRGRRWPAVSVAGAVYLGFTFLSSGAALAAPLAGLAAFLLVWLWGRRGALALAAVAVILALTAPQVVSSALSVERVEAMAAKAPASPGHRVRMWAFAVEKVDEKPIWGWGMDASRSMPGGHEQIAPGTEILPLHPHNAFLQVRLELGLPGAAIVAALLGVFFAVVIGGMNDRGGRAVAAGAGVAYLTVAAISYGVWQNWWVAFAWALAAMTALAVGPSAPTGGRDGAASGR